MSQKNKYCAGCPCLNNSKNPSPEAIDRVHQIQANNQIKGSRKEPVSGCQWAINSIDHNYCFWNYAKEIDGPVSDKEICHLEGITQTQLKETLQSAIKKIKKNLNNPDIKEWIESLRETVYSKKDGFTTGELLPEAYNLVDTITENEKKIFYSEDEDIEKLLSDLEKLRKGKKINSYGMPMHRDGKKVDLYGLYSENKLREKHGKPKNKPKKEN